VSPKRALFAHLAIVAQALAHQHRLELIDLLSQGEHSVEVLARRTGLSIANTSQHLQLLRRSGVARARRDGRYVYYRVSDDDVVTLVERLRQVGEGHPPEMLLLLAEHLTPLDPLPAVTAEALLPRLARGEVTCIDARPADEYHQGHIAHAVNVPPGTVDDHLAALPREQPIIAYCRGPYCTYSFEAVARLRRLGYDVHRLELGFPQWRAAGYPVAVDAAVQPGQGAHN